VLLALATVLVVSIVVFLLTRVFVPISVVDIILGEYAKHDLELRVRVERDLGLDISVPMQYVQWLGRILRADLGESLHSGRSVTAELGPRLALSAELGLIALALTTLAAIPLGIAAAVWQDRPLDYVARGLALLVGAAPTFWIAILALVIASKYFEWAPSIRYVSPAQDFAGHVRSVWMPVLVVAIGAVGTPLRLVRTQMLEVLRQDYVRTAQAKGLRTRTVILVHALRNALIPVVTAIGFRFPTLMVGALTVELVFGLPGLGRYLVDSIRQLDYPAIQGAVLVYSFVLTATALIVDLSYAYLDPRIRYA
jgi:peptide/nickel transport system permease protein